MTNKTETAAYAMADALTETRHSLHRIPEPGKKEIKTSSLIRGRLDKFGIAYKTVCTTGTVCTIRGTGDNDRTVLLRADIDALPITEESGVDFASEHHGCMHACGHDVHTTCLLGAAKILNDMRDEFSGTAVLVFQPNEELEGGALPMINAGILDNPRVDAAFALHVEPLERVGNIQIRDGAIMASPDDFEIVIHGTGGHGAYPEKCTNPIEIGARILERYRDEVPNDVEKQVVSICSFNAGNCRNAIPQTAVMTGTARSLDREVRKKLRERLEDIAKQTARDMGGRAEFNFSLLFPPVINDTEANDYVRAAAKHLDCVKNVVTLERASMTGDDFSYFGEIVPSSYFKLGVGNADIGAVYPLHSPKFRADDAALPIGAAMMAQVALEYLGDCT